jgi:hypothetical protein
MNHPALPPDLFERVVQEVIRRLIAQGMTVQRPEAVVTDLMLDQKVVTLNQLEGRLNGIRRLVVKRRAIVTPAVKDELRTRGIELQRTDD